MKNQFKLFLYSYIIQHNKNLPFVLLVSFWKNKAKNVFNHIRLFEKKKKEKK